MAPGSACSSSPLTEKASRGSPLSTTVRSKSSAGPAFFPEASCPSPSAVSTAPASPAAAVMATPRALIPLGSPASSGAPATPTPMTATTAAPTPRSAKRQGLTAFTDPTNPSGRTNSKHVNTSSMLREARGDASRAGGRTRNPGIMPANLGGVQLSPKDARERLVPHRYGNDDWRPGRAAATCSVSGQPSPRGHNSEGVGEALGSVIGFPGWAPALLVKDQQQARTQQPATATSALGNYLNDMKRVGRSRRAVPAEPSPALRRMNDVRHKLPVEISGERRAASAEAAGACRQRRSANAESEGEEVYGFSKKCPVRGRSANLSPRNFLAHEEGGASRPATPNGERQNKASQRFEEVVAHMKASASTQREHFETIKTKSGSTSGLLYSESPIKHIF